MQANRQATAGVCVENPDRVFGSPTAMQLQGGESVSRSGEKSRIPIFIMYLNTWHGDCSCLLRHLRPSRRKPMKAIAQINMYDLATVFIAFGMVLGLAFK